LMGVALPFALPFVAIGIKEVVLWAVGVIATTVLVWSLTTPSGRVTWSRIRAWVETQIKAPVEYALEGIKRGLAETAEAWDSFRKGLKAYIEWAYDYLWKMHDWIMGYIYAYVLPRIATLEKWRVDCAAWLHKVIEANLLYALKSLAELWTIVNHYILRTLGELEAWRTACVKWLHTYIEKLLLQTRIELNLLKEVVRGGFEQVNKRFEEIKAGVISLGLEVVSGLTSDVLPGIWDVMKDFANKVAKATGLATAIGAVGTLINRLFDEMGRELKPDVDFLTEIELDPLLLAYLKLTKPAVIDRADELLNALVDSYNRIMRG